MKKNGRRSAETATGADRVTVRGIAISRPATVSESFGRGPQNLVDRFEEEELAPHDRLVDAELLVEVIDAVLEHALPAGSCPRQVSVGAECVEDGERGVAVASAPVRVGGAVSSARFQRPEAAMAAAELSSIRSGPSGTSKSQGGTRLAGHRARK